MRWFLALVVLLGLIAAGAYEWEQASYYGAGPAAQNTTVIIKSGTGLRGISDQLAVAGVIRNANIFFWGVRLRRTTEKLKAGEYLIPAYASEFDIVKLLESGKTVKHKVTAPEGRTSDMIAKIVNADPVLQGPPVATPAEGTLLPETYLFQRGDTRQQIIARMTKDQEELVDRLWAERRPNLPFKTKEEAITLASIVEKETALPGERRHIAGVFINRLRTGMQIQSDPTIIYGLTQGYPLGHGIRESELHRATPYNTYIIPGLPPGPICNPGKDAIAAVLDPMDTKDLYFVANGQGGHVFSASVADQNRHVAELRERERIEKLNRLPVPVSTVPPLR
ncbi:MAG: endolytic transglycosylase MltG [Alphaproteobacteria bacterium]|nr:endolytic transglycosylase MltG [Alphaproteobacteria bacterium]MBL6938066.1 endolytic transglycosylase MltG [Alphaproteobacteria bacterium]MBL7099876.1 endolytic transglycosylase MltG [Alphaproteobacteria bacterium]